MSIFEKGQVAPSTCAASIFSILATQGPLATERVATALAFLGFEAHPDDLREAVRELVERNLIAISDGVLRSRYASGWVVVARSDTDSTGWAGWVMKNVRTGEQRLFADMRQEI